MELINNVFQFIGLIVSIIVGVFLSGKVIEVVKQKTKEEQLKRSVEIEREFNKQSADSIVDDLVSADDVRRIQAESDREFDRVKERRRNADMDR